MLHKLLSITLFAFFASTLASAQYVVMHSVPFEFISDEYIVFVNGKKAEVFQANENVCFVSFEFDSLASITIKKVRGGVKKENPVNFWRGAAVVRPLSKGIQFKTLDNEVSFNLKSTGQYAVEPSGTGTFRDDVIYIFANKTDRKPINKTAKNTIYLEAGIHQQNIDLKSGQHLYLESGAVLYGCVNIWDAENVSIEGKGTIVYCGPQSINKDVGWKNIKNWHPITTRHSKNICVKNINIVNRSRTYSIQMHETFDTEFENIKILSLNPQNINGDGLDWFGGGRSVVRNCFIRSADDCFAFFTPQANESMWSIEENSEGEVKDITVENCVLFPSLANVFRLGFNGQNILTKNITLKNCDIIHFKNGTWLQTPSAIFCTLTTNNRGTSKHVNYLVEDLRIEDSLAFFGFQNKDAHFENFILRNLQMNAVLIPSVFRSTMDGFKLENVMINNKLIQNPEELQ